MLGQAVQADASRACGSPAAASRLAQAMANSPVVMASTGKRLHLTHQALTLATAHQARCSNTAGLVGPLHPPAVLPQGVLLQMMGPAGLMQAVQIASQVSWGMRHLHGVLGLLLVQPLCPASV